MHSGVSCHFTCALLIFWRFVLILFIHADSVNCNWFPVSTEGGEIESLLPHRGILNRGKKPADPDLYCEQNSKFSLVHCIWVPVDFEYKRNIILFITTKPYRARPHTMVCHLGPCVKYSSESRYCRDSWRCKCEKYTS